MRFAGIQLTQAIHGFQAGNVSFKKYPGRRFAFVPISRTRFTCPGCGSPNVSAYRERERTVRALPVGRCACILRVTVHRLRCADCGAREYEKLPFLSSPKARVTRELERTILELRADMSISAVADFFGLDWKTVKDIEKNALGRKYAHVPLKDVKRIAIDEIYAFPKAAAHEKYVTVARDLDTGAVLFVGRGKGVRALDPFTRSLRKFKKNITLVAMDMSNAYTAWAVENLPNADIVYDPFHLVKAVNEKLDSVRRRVSRGMDEATKASIKGSRFLFLRNAERLAPDDASSLEAARAVCRELSDAYMLKEKLRSIYALARDEFDARGQLDAWCVLAEGCGVAEMAAMAKLIRKHEHGIAAYWRSGGASNASQEGFNNKIRWLIRQAYGFHDYEYFRLKIFDLPSTNIKKAL
jgi:transposase